MLGEGLRLIRVFHDVSQSELAKRLDVVQSLVSEIEKGKKQPTVQMLEKYSEIFDIPMSSIMFFSEALERNTPSERARIAISKKIIRMLDFIADKAESSDD